MPYERKPGVSKPRASTHHKQGAVAVMQLRPAIKGIGLHVKAEPQTSDKSSEPLLRIDTAANLPRYPSALRA